MPGMLPFRMGLPPGVRSQSFHALVTDGEAELGVSARA